MPAKVEGFFFVLGSGYGSYDKSARGEGWVLPIWDEKAAWNPPSALLLLGDFDVGIVLQNLLPGGQPASACDSSSSSLSASDTAMSTKALGIELCSHMVLISSSTSENSRI